MKMRNGRHVLGVAIGAALALMLAGAGGCGTLDRAYKQQVTWTNAPVVQVLTNTVVVTNLVPVVTERTNTVYVTNATSGAVSGYVAREPVATNLVAAMVTNFVPVFYTNVVQVPVTNLVARPEAVPRLPPGPEPQGERGAGPGRGDRSGRADDDTAGPGCRRAVR